VSVVVVLGVRTTVVVGAREILVVGVGDVVPLPEPPISPSQTISQDFVFKLFGTWSQKWSLESRTKKPAGRETLPVRMRPERKASACAFMENASA
jgi:hypothetical protein